MRLILTRLLGLLGVCVPPAVVLIAVLHYHIDVPYMDAWSLIPLLDKYFNGSLPWHDMLAPHNTVHIVFIPRLIMLLLAKVSHWNTLWESAVTLLASMISLVVILRAVMSSRTLAPCTIWLAPCLSALQFSLIQAENWIWGWQMQIPLCVMFFSIGSYYLCLGKRNFHYIVAFISGLCATLCFGAGVLFWPISIALVLARHRPVMTSDMSTATRSIWILLSLTALAFTLIFITTASNSHGIADLNTVSFTTVQISPQAITSIISTLVIFSCITTGAIIAQGNIILTALAGAIVIATSVILFRITPVSSEEKTLKQFLLMLFIFGIGTCLLIASGRSIAGLDQALSSRYMTLAVPIYTSLIAMLAINFKQKTKNRTFFPVAISILTLLILVNSWQGISVFEKNHRHMSIGSKALLNPTHEKYMWWIRAINPYMPEEAIQNSMAIMQRNHLSIYR